jgi:hypothetical protein
MKDGIAVLGVYAVRILVVSLAVVYVQLAGLEFLTAVTVKIAIL